MPRYLKFVDMFFLYNVISAIRWFGIQLFNIKNSDPACIIAVIFETKNEMYKIVTTWFDKRFVQLEKYATYNYKLYFNRTSNEKKKKLKLLKWTK